MLSTLSFFFLLLYLKFHLLCENLIRVLPFLFRLPFVQELEV